MCTFIFNKPVRLQKHKKYDTQKEQDIGNTFYSCLNMLSITVVSKRHSGFFNDQVEDK
jgi:hypothetical protein